MLTVACVKWGAKYGPDYVHKLQDGVSRHLTIPHKFVCFTDDPTGLECETRPLPGDLEGWWNKVYLFKRGLFDDRVLFLDLDVVVVDSLDEVAQWPHKFGIIKDWHYDAYNSSCFVMDPDSYPEVWDDFTPDVRERLHGDQDWITEKVEAEIFPPEWFSSFKSHSKFYPYGKVVVFHGNPNPSDYPADWVRMQWKIGGPTEGELAVIEKGFGLTPVRVNVTCNTQDEALLDNVRANLSREVAWLKGIPEHNKRLLIACGGPSLKGQIGKIRQQKARGVKILTVNGAHNFLVKAGIKPDYFAMIDARDTETNRAFVASPVDSCLYFIASQCAPAIFDALEGQNVILWHTFANGIQQVLEGIDDKPVGIIGGGGTVGLRSMYLAHLLGFRRIDVYGMDSSMEGDRQHAYNQSIDTDQAFDVLFDGRKFRVTAILAKQAEEFQKMYRVLRSNGMKVRAHGNGLIPTICKKLNENYKEEENGEQQNVSVQ